MRRSVRRQMIWDILLASAREALDHWVLRLCGAQLVLQATICDCLAFEPFAFEEDGLSAPEMDVSQGRAAGR